jgi:hypothetical protein
VIGGTMPAAASVTSLNGSQLAGMRNLVHNGAFEIDQRYAGAATTMNAATQFCADRWLFVSTQTGKIQTQAQIVNSLTLGTTRCLEVACTTTVPSPAAGDNWNMQHRIEGWNAARLGWGTGNAQAATLSFAAYCTVAGTFAVSLRNGTNARSFVATFTLAAATWTKFAIPIPGDTAGTWATDNTTGATVTFSFASGTNFNVPATGVWQAGNYTSAAGTINFLATTAIFFISNVQLELGNVATPFEHLDIAQKLAICQRYFQKTQSMSTAVGASPGPGSGGVSAYPSPAASAWMVPMPFKTSMRASPTVTFYDNAGTAGKTSYYTGAWTNGGAVPTTFGLTDQSMSVAFAAIGASSYYNCDVTLSAEL